MPLRQQIVALAIGLALLILIVELIRRRRLREEYSVLWFVTGVTVLVLAAWYDLLVAITGFIGAALPTSTLFFFALIFLILVSLQFSVRISTLDHRVKELAQKLALVEAKEPEPESEPDAQTSRKDEDEEEPESEQRSG
jgi:hypothetical protein